MPNPVATFEVLIGGETVRARRASPSPSPSPSLALARVRGVAIAPIRSRKRPILAR